VQIDGDPEQVLQGEAHGWQTPATLVVPSGQFWMHWFWNRLVRLLCWSQLVQLVIEE
jgi:hypothetical protein